MAEPFVNDPDFTLHIGDALQVLQAMPAESIHCCVTSPPYWGLRDYGTGTWDGGDADCDHRIGRTMGNENKGAYREVLDGDRERCKCGATRVDQQLGLEPTPDEYVTNMVNVFREVRRVLRSDGTLWLNLGDSYCSQPNQRVKKPGGRTDTAGWKQDSNAGSLAQGDSYDPGLKPKDLIGVPWRVAFALQADGWYLRSDIIWSKPNPMPESVTDRPTKAHEYVFLLSKSPRYFYDADAIREDHSPDGRLKTVHDHATPNSHENYDNVGNGNERWPNGGRNKRSVWEIATAPYPDAHFATFPPALVEPCVKAGCPEWVCGTCGKARERETARAAIPQDLHDKKTTTLVGDDVNDMRYHNVGGGRYQKWLDANPVETTGWSDCGHNNYQPGVVLDPFLGSGTTAQVARRLGRRCIGIELNPEYAELAARRLQQLSLFAVETAEA